MSQGSSTERALTAALERHFKRRAILTGRGTSALFTILTAIRARYGSGSVLLPDMACYTVLDAVLLAGFTPHLVDITERRYTLRADQVRSLITPETRAILMLHTFGHIADVLTLRRAASQQGILLIEDAVQGIGGAFNGLPVGTLGDLSFLSFQPGKTLQGGAGAILWNDPVWTPYLKQAIAALERGDLPALHPDQLCELTSPVRAESYLYGLRARSARLLTPFDARTADPDLMLNSLDTLSERVTLHNGNAAAIIDQLLDHPDLSLPALRPGDAIWRVAIAARTPLIARRYAHEWAQAGIAGANDYLPFSAYFGALGNGRVSNRYSTTLADRMLNVFVHPPIPGPSPTQEGREKNYPDRLYRPDLQRDGRSRQRPYKRIL